MEYLIARTFFAAKVDHDFANDMANIGKALDRQMLCIDGKKSIKLKFIANTRTEPQHLLHRTP